jgi:hypothetical protein
MKALIVMSFLFIGPKLLSQNDFDKNKYLLSVTVNDAYRNKGIVNAKVTIKGDDSSSFVRYTDTCGSFNTYLDFAVLYDLEVTSPSYFKAFGKEVGPHDQFGVSHLYELLRIEDYPRVAPLITYDSNMYDNPRDPSYPNTFPLDFSYSILSDNPKIKADLIGYRDKFESKYTSLDRALFAKHWLIEVGVNPDRLNLIDGGTNEELTQQVLFTHVDDTEIKHNRLLIIRLIDN